MMNIYQVFNFQATKTLVKTISDCLPTTKGVKSRAKRLNQYAIISKNSHLHKFQKDK